MLEITSKLMLVSSLYFMKMIRKSWDLRFLERKFAKDKECTYIIDPLNRDAMVIEMVGINLGTVISHARSMVSISSNLL